MAQNVRNPSAVLKDDFVKYDSVLTQLRNGGLITEGLFHRFTILRTTPAGSEKASMFVLSLLARIENSLANLLRGRLKIARFLVHHVFESELSWPVHWPGDLFFDWRDIVLGDPRVRRFITDFLSLLSENGLAVHSKSFVSTRRGEIREDVHVIPREVRDSLARFGEKPLDLEETSPFRLADFFREASKLSKYSDVERARELLFLMLESHQLSGEEVSHAVEQARQRGLEVSFDPSNSSAIFSAEPKFAEYVTKTLFDPAIEELVQSRTTEIRVTRSATSNLSDFLKLYIEIGQLELAIREEIKRRMEEKLGKKWTEHEKLKGVLDLWKRKAEDDDKALVEREPELINYADFAEYGQIIQAFPKIFDDLFPEPIATRQSLNRVNALGRKAVMHFRSLSPEKLYVTFYEIRSLRKALEARR